MSDSPVSVARISDIGSGSFERAAALLKGIKNGAYCAVNAALQRAAASGKTQAGRFAAERYYIRKSDFMDNVTIKQHVEHNADGTISLNISYAGYVLPLLTFRTRVRSGGLLETQVKRGGPGSTLDHAFAARVYDRTAVFERRGKERFPVKQLYGPSTAHMMRDEEVVKRMDETIRDTYEKRIEHELERVINGWGR